MRRSVRPAALAMVAALMILSLPSAAAAARPLDGLRVHGQTAAVIGELATLTVKLPANVAAFDARVITAPGAAEVIGVAPVGGGTALRPEASGDGTAVAAYGLASRKGVTRVLIAVNPLVAGRIQARVIIDAASDAAGHRVTLRRTSALATITAGAGRRLVAAPAARMRLAPKAKSVKPFDLRLDRKFNAQDLDMVRAAWSQSHANVGAICGGATAGDANGDGCVDIIDVQLLKSVSGKAVTAKTSSTLLATEPDLSSTRAVLSTTPDVTSVGDFVPLRTFTVTSTGDTADATPGNGICADSNGRCTLRAAMTEADYMQGEDRIAFNLPGTAPVTIQVSSRLPLITSRSGGVFIDGYSQPGASPNTAQVGSNAVPGVYLRGNGNAAREYGFYMTSANNIVSGLAIGNFWRALMLDGTDATGNLIAGDWLGFTGTGSNNGGSIGILINVGAHDNTVGTPALADRNVIGNFPVGVDVYGPGTDGTTFQNNQFCISPSGARATCNVGIDHNFGPKRNLIGGSGANERNVFGPTNYQGIELSHGYNPSVQPDTDFSLPYQINDHQIIGNWVGFRMDGTYDPAYRSGLNFSSADNAEGINVYDGVFNNLVEDNYVASVYDGIILRSPHASDNILRGNVIGVAPNGGGAAPLTGWGIKIGWSATHNLVEDNVIRNAAAGGIGLVNTTNTGLPQAPAYNIKLSRNLVSDTNGPAIDLFGIAGPDPNDPGDADLGANGLLNTPIITGVTTTTVSGTGQAGATVEVYTVSRAIGAYGLPQAYQGSAVVAGNGTWTLATTLTGSDVVSAIQIAPDWNTSEFSPNAGFGSPSITSASSTTFPAGQASSFTVTTTGNPAPAISRSGALPSGVTFTDNGNGTATLAGTPAIGSQGNYPLTITAANGALPNATQSFTLTVTAAVVSAPAITSAASTTYVTGTAGSFTVTTTGVPTPTIGRTGALPSGVTFTDNGNGTATLAGTPAAGTSGTYPLTITATNGVSPNASQSFTLTVHAAPAITSAASVSFSIGSAGSFTMTTTGTPTPSITRAGSLPSGITFTDHGDGTATLAGTPTAGSGGTYPLSITASNGVLPNASQAFTLFVTAAPAITSVDHVSFIAGITDSFTVTTTGTPVPGIARTGALPAGVTFTDNGNGTATLAGTPDTGSAGTYPLTITAGNGVNPDATQSFTLTVTQLTTYATDSFGRNVRNNWGTADLGGDWLVSTARAFTVDGSIGSMDLQKSQTRWATLGDVSARDVDLQVSLGFEAIPGAGNAYDYLVARQVSSGNEYRAKIRVTSTGAVYAQLLAVTGGTEAGISSEVLVGGVTATPGVSLRARFVVTGLSPTSLQFKVWNLGQPEPGAWSVTATDSTAALQAYGAVGVRAYLSSNASPNKLLFLFDDLAALVP